MRDADIDKLIKDNIKTTASPELDRRIDELVEGAEKQHQTSNIWRIGMTNKITKFAAAAVVIIGVLLFVKTLINLNETPVVAKLSDSIDAAWDDDMGIPDEDGKMRQSTYQLTEGYVSILFNDGAEVTVEAPAEFSLNSGGDMELLTGSIYAVVPKKAVGFTVAAGNSKIVDLGTEFGVDVNKKGSVQLHAAKGTLMLFSGLRSGGAMASTRVNQGTARLVASTGTVWNIPFAKDKFVRHIDSDKGLTSKNAIASGTDKEARKNRVVSMMSPELGAPSINEVQVAPDLLGHKRNIRIPDDGWIMIGKGMFWHYSGGKYLSFSQEDVRVYVTIDGGRRQFAGLRFSKPEDIGYLYLAMEELTEPTILLCEQQLPPEFLELPNQHLISELQRTPIKGGPIKASKEDFLRRSRLVKFADITALGGLTGLTALDLRGCDELADLSPLENLTNLTSLNLSGCHKVTDLTPLSKLDKLESLDLRAWNLNSELNDISGISDLRALKSLNLRLRTNLSDLTPLENLENLETLDLAGCSNDIADLSALAKLRKLKSLKIDELYDKQNAPPLGNLTNLEYLKIGSLNKSYGVNAKASDISFLTKLTKLEHLELSQCFGEIDLEPIGHLTNLAHLKVNRFTKLLNITPIGELTNLQTLELGNCDKVTDITPIGELTQLKSLDLNSCEILSDLSPIKNLTKLEELDLGSCDSISDLSPLGHLANLKSLNLSRCKNISDLSALDGLVELKSVRLHNCPKINKTDLKKYYK